MHYKKQLPTSFLFFLLLLSFLSCSNDSGGDNTPPPSYEGNATIEFTYKEGLGSSRVSSLELYIYDSENNQTYFQQWNYTDLSKLLFESEDDSILLENVPANPECKLIVLGKQIDGDIVTRAEKDSFSIDSSRVTNPVTLTSQNFCTDLTSPIDRSTSTTDTLPNFTWEPVPGAVSYRIVVSERRDNFLSLIDEIANENEFPSTIIKEHALYQSSEEIEPEKYYPFPDTGQETFYDSLDTIRPAPQSPEDPNYGDYYGQDAQYLYLSPSYSAIEFDGTEHFETENEIKKYRWEVYPIDEFGNIGYSCDRYDFYIIWRMNRDNITGLTWEVKTVLDDSIHEKDKKFTWQEAALFVEDLNVKTFGGYNDWRLPTIKELYSLMRDPVTKNSLLFDEHFFPNTVPAPFRSSTLYAGYETKFEDDISAWIADFSTARVSEFNYTKEPLRVRAVRGTAVPSYFEDNGDNTVSYYTFDKSSGDYLPRLMWSKEVSPTPMTWQEALEYCEDLVAAGHDDWRLPNKNELQSIIDYTRREGIDPDNNGIKDESAIVTVLSGSDPASIALQYWSSTTSIFNPRNAYTIHFGTGACSTNNKVGSIIPPLDPEPPPIWVRPVRNLP
ncbi:MAG: DUF1566 domain-containing protein [Desulfobacteraceae bacterium]|nr:MAG: DUF1566 domain-containing protein [Desulfobacteraceae bacterium]